VASILPVIHYRSDELCVEAARLAFEAGCPGVFLIHMGGYDRLLDGPAVAIKSRWPEKFVGTNRLAMAAPAAIRHDASLGLDGTWSDAPGINTTRMGDLAPVEAAFADARARHPAFAFFASVAFKYQAREPDPPRAAAVALAKGWVPTTSGAATGVAADMGKLAAMRAALGAAAPLAVASGVTPENVEAHLDHVSHVLVATGVSFPGSEDFDPARLSALVAAARRA